MKTHKKYFICQTPKGLWYIGGLKVFFDTFAEAIYYAKKNKINIALKVY